MTIEFDLETFKGFLFEFERRVKYAKHVGGIAGVKPEMQELYDQVLNEISELNKVAKKTLLKVNYIQQLTEAARGIESKFTSGPMPDRLIESYTLEDSEKPIFKFQFERDEIEIRNAIDVFRLIFKFFSSLDFLSCNLVAIGANGCGKTLLADNLKLHIRNSGVVISAQRVLIVPVINSIQGSDLVSDNLKSVQTSSKTIKDDILDENIQQEFEFLLQGIISNHAASNNDLKRALRKGPVSGLPKTNLEKMIEIWNGLFKHRSIDCVDGMNIMVYSSSDEYHSSKMSEGEKVVLYLIAQILQSPQDGFIIVDEPEMHLHPTIHRKLWDILEAERPDCIFIYFTHDLDFATGRTNAKKLWLRSFEFPAYFQMEEIPANDIPTALLFELLGSRHNIMFCEGGNGSLDEKIYNLLFPDYVIKPVGGCLAVINYTKAYNKIPNLTTKAVGIIDADYHSSERLKSLEPEKVFSIKVAEIENLLMDETLLVEFNRELLDGKISIGDIKQEVLAKLASEKDVQIANYISTRINNYLNGSHVERGSDISHLEKNFDDFISKVEINSWAQERSAKIDNILQTKNYTEVIRILNDKGLISIANKHFKMLDFKDRILKLLGQKPGLRSRLQEYFPSQLSSLSTSS